MLDEQIEEGLESIKSFLNEMEHQQMRNLLARMSEAVSSGDREEILEVGETMMILMQQHNVKEEEILYPMADQHLASYRE